MFMRRFLYLHNTMRRQWHSVDMLKKYQEGKFKALLRHAYANTTFYNEKFKKAGITPDDILGMDDLHKIPFITKKEIIENFPGKLMAKNYISKRLHYRKTSGSSGLQMTVATDQRCEDFYDTIYARALFSLGYRPWQAMAYFWPPTYHRKKLHEYFGLMKKDWLSSTLPPEEQLSILEKIKPRIIYGFPTTLMVMAKIIEKNRTKYVRIRPRFIISHAETLFEDSRNYIEFVFGCPVYNEYGTTEFVRMAWECKERKGLHIDVDSVILEILKDGRPCQPGETGEIVLTGLHNYAMPLIRYRIGDIGSMSDAKCPCGRGLPLLKTIEGRDDSFLTLPSDKILSPRHIVPLVEKFPQITEFRLVQEEKTKIVLYIVDNPSITGQVIGGVRNELYKLIEKEVDLRVEKVDRLDKTQRGKMQAIVSKVKPELYKTS